MFVCSLMMISSDSSEELDQRERFQGCVPSLALSEFILRKSLELRLFISLFLDCSLRRLLAGSLKARLC